MSGRKKLSGSQYRKNAKEKKEREDEMQAKMQKLDRFIVSDKVTASTPEILAKGKSENMGTRQIENNDLIEVQITTKTEVLDAVTVKKYDPNTSKSDTIQIHNDLGTVESTAAVCELQRSEILSHVIDNRNRMSKDPAKWVLNDSTIEYLLTHGIEQNIDNDFTNSKQQYTDKTRVLTKNVFLRHHPNGEVKPRKYLVYSESQGAVFCAPCRLFGGVSSLATSGYRDWKNISTRLREHENSKEHNTCVLKMVKRGEISGRIDVNLKIQMEEEIVYWRNVLTRILAVVKKLSSRGLPFRGSVEKFGSPHNGNYMMALELIAEFDPFLANHIARYGNEGRGNTSYLSSHICDEFIELIAAEVVSNIVKEVKKAKYFSIIVDSTPDISHVDQLSFVIRYVNDDGMPVERFLCFLPNTGHKSEQLADAVLSTLKSYGLDIANCRGQSYDNASNMSGAYGGLQARIKNINPYAVYVPCSAHSLNLVGICAAESCQEACGFFSIVQHLYTFFSASTHRWEILLATFQPNSKVIKRLCETRWSSRAEACHNLSGNWNGILKALGTIKEDATEKPVTRSEAAGLRKSLERLETAFMAVFWTPLLDRFHVISKKLQSVNIDVQTVLELYCSLIGYTESIRDLFDVYEEKAKEISDIQEYESDSRRKRKRKLQSDETHHGEVEMCGRDKFRIDTFLMILDRITSELKRRSNAYQELYSRFQFFSNITEISTVEITEHATKLQQYYQGDLEKSLADECIQFQSLLESIEIDDSEKTSISRHCNVLRKRHLDSEFSNVDIALRMFVCTPATNCSAERSFSALKRVKNYLRANLSEAKLNSLSVLAIEKDLTISVDYTELINKFAAQKSRRRPM